MTENIFENAKFGTLYNLYNNQLGVLVCITDNCAVIISEGGCQYMTNLDGTLIENPKEIIVLSKYKEPIDEDKYKSINTILDDGFEAGYNKAIKDVKLMVSDIKSLKKFLNSK